MPSQTQPIVGKAVKVKGLKHERSFKRFNRFHSLQKELILRQIRTILFGVYLGKKIYPNYVGIS